MTWGKTDRHLETIEQDFCHALVLALQRKCYTEGWPAFSTKFSSSVPQWMQSISQPAEYASSRGSTVQIGTNIKIRESGLLFRIVITIVITKVTQ
jgi:hypothetical protein